MKVEKREQGKEGKVKRGARIEAILDVLFEESLDAVHLLAPLVGRFLAAYERSYRKNRAYMSGDTSSFDREERERRREKEYLRFRASLSHLRTEGFISGKKLGRSVLWSLTKEGRQRLREIKKRRTPYECEGSDMLIVVSYDIPEVKRKSRAWVRDILKFLKEIDQFFNFIFWPKQKEILPQVVLDSVKHREKYRKEQNWQKADEIRQKIKKLGWFIEDTDEGPKVKRL